MTREELLASPPDDYMNAEQLGFFRELLRTLRAETMNNIEDAKQRLAKPPEVNDDADRSSHEEEVRLALRIVDRERRLLPKIQAALDRIDDGEYGFCRETGEPIGLPRLLVRPTADLSAQAKELAERRERQFVHKRDG
ncbi:MAG: TraR/DksA C4-type zinc finger protein [Marinobacter sp.]|uniref:TraR/DksA C4-type zinc finger protein n=1 Tax=Marinobacter sp. TaxID=50741 RepID=UPI00299E2ACC|nr:TraR/DksA C4-type zinc finger protein [Marinobacter sp.]MDX1755281.1 TraR/DksA C4-type zinc finger protein [Marinobacter sp.]